MNSSSKDRENASRDDCQIHVDKEGESCVIKIENIGQEKILKELLNAFNHLKTELNQFFLLKQQQQQQPKEIFDIIEKKFQFLDDQLQKLIKSIGSNQKLHLDFIQKFDHLDKTFHDEEQKRLSSDLQNLKPILDTLQILQLSFEKEKTKPDILARKLDSIDQKLKESHSESHLTIIKDIQMKIDKSTLQTNDLLIKINDRIKSIHTETIKSHPDIIKQFNEQSNHIIIPMKEFINEKLNPFIEHHQNEIQINKDKQDKLGSRNIPDRDDNSHSPNRLPLCINGMIPNLFDPYVFHALASEIDKKLMEIQIKLSSSEEFKRKQDEFIGNLIKQQTPLIDEIKRLTPIVDKIKQQQQKDSDHLNRELDKSFQPITLKLNDLSKQHDLIQTIDSKFNHFIQNIDKEKDLKHRLDTQLDIGKEITNRIQPLEQVINNLSKEQQPLMNVIRELPKRLDDIRQSQSQSNLITAFSSKLDPLTQSLQLIRNDLNQQTQTRDQDNQILIKLTQTLTDKQKRPEISEDIQKAFHPFSQIIQTLKHNIEQSQIEQQIKTTKLDHLEQRLSKSLDKITSDMIDPILKKLNEIIQQDKTTLETILKQIHLNIQPHQQSVDMKINNEKIDPLNNLNEQMKHISNQINSQQIESSEFLKIFDKQQQQIQIFFNDIQKNSSYQIKDMNEHFINLDKIIQQLPNQILSKSKHLSHIDDHENQIHLRQIPLNQSTPSQDSNHFITISDEQTTNLFINLLILQTTIQNRDYTSCHDIEPFIKRIEQSSLIKNDHDLLKLVQRLKDLCSNNKSIKTNSDLTKANETNPSYDGIHRTSIEHQSSTMNNNILRKHETKSSLPFDYLTKSRYISMISEQTIRDNWPKLSQRATSVIETIINQPFEFDNGTYLDHLIQQNNLEHYSILRRNAINKSNKDYDQICYMMDSIVFDQMTMIGSREAFIRPWNPSLLNRASSKGSYPYLSGNGRMIERFQVNRDISLWMVETDEKKVYLPSEFLPNNERLNEKYHRIQHPQFSEIRQKRREDETRWNERYAFTKDNRTILFVNDLRSYFMDYDTKRKYQVHDDVPINPVCRTGIAGRGDLPFWGPNHCVVVILLRNINEPEVVLMKHHGDALVLPKGFYGHEARYDNQIKIIQDPVAGQILPPTLFDYWWSQVVKLNEINNSINHLKRILNDKELKEEFAEIFSQKGCNKSVFDNGYVDHPLNTDHAWVESSIWKIQFKDWRIPEMKTVKYAIADDSKTNHNHTSSFVWMKLIDAILIVPPFDRGILVDVLATGMPL